MADRRRVGVASMEGHRVILFGLARSELNGRRGRTVAETAAQKNNGRIGVELEPAGERLAVRPDNLFFSLADRMPAALASWMAAQKASQLADQLLFAEKPLPQALRLLLMMSVELLEMVASTGRIMLREAALKFSGTAIAFVSREAAFTRSVIYRRHSDQGLFTNLIEVMESLSIAESTGAHLVIDWRRTGTESHFVYGSHDFDLLGYLFEQHDGFFNAASQDQGLPPSQDDENDPMKGNPYNPFFYSNVRGLLWRSRHLSEMRASFAAAAGAHLLRPTAVVKAEVDATLQRARSAGTRFVLAVHKRVATPGVAAIQLTMRVPGVDEFVESAREALIEWALGADGIEDDDPAPFAGCTIVLASDDSHAPPAFAAACSLSGGRLAGATLVYREHVRRTEGGALANGTDNESHLIGGTRLQDAVDALVDGLTLSECDGLVHIDSSVSMFAAFRSPSLKLHNAGRLIPPSQATTMSHKAARRLRVINESGVFVRAEPTVASAALNYKRMGEILNATGKTSGKWAEVVVEGNSQLHAWVLTDATGLGVDLVARKEKPLGKLVEPIDESTLDEKFDWQALDVS